MAVVGKHKRRGRRAIMEIIVKLFPPRGVAFGRWLTDLVGN
jgi:hypothetical protein